MGCCSCSDGIGSFTTFDRGGIYQFFIGSHGDHAVQLEGMLLGLEDMTPDLLRQISLESSRGRSTRHSYGMQLLRAFIVVPTTSLFYALLLIVTVVFYRFVI